MWAGCLQGRDMGQREGSGALSEQAVAAAANSNPQVQGMHCNEQASTRSGAPSQSLPYRVAK